MAVNENSSTAGADRSADRPTTDAATSLPSLCFEGYINEGDLVLLREAGVDDVIRIPVAELARADELVARLPAVDALRIGQRYAERLERCRGAAPVRCLGGKSLTTCADLATQYYERLRAGQDVELAAFLDDARSRRDGRDAGLDAFGDKLQELLAAYVRRASCGITTDSNDISAAFGLFEAILLLADSIDDAASEPRVFSFVEVLRATCEKGMRLLIPAQAAEAQSS